jgi:hypothetical protein
MNSQLRARSQPCPRGTTADNEDRLVTPKNALVLQSRLIRRCQKLQNCRRKMKIRTNSMSWRDFLSLPQKRTSEEESVSG